MDQVFRLRDSIIGYISPAHRRRTMLTPNHAADKLGSMNRPFQPMSDPIDRTSRDVANGRVSKKYLSPSDTRKARRHSYGLPDDEEYDDEIEEESELHPDDSASREVSYEVLSQEEGDEDVSESEEVEVLLNKAPELTVEEKVALFLDRQAEIQRVHETLEKIKDQNWHPDEIALYRRLSMRGLEALLPSTWKWDFRTTPAQMFTDNDDETYINSSCGKEARAAKALTSLVTLGGRVRDLRLVGIPPEKKTKKEIEDYIKWSEKDGEYYDRKFIPVLAIVAGGARQEIERLSKAVTDQLEFLALKHRQHLSLPPPGRVNEHGEVEMFAKPPPLLYGIILTGTVFVFVTLDSSNSHAKVRTIADFTFNNSELDVWNGLALAIIVIAARNYMISIRDDLELESPDNASDPDL